MRYKGPSGERTILVVKTRLLQSQDKVNTALFPIRSVITDKWAAVEDRPLRRCLSGCGWFVRYRPGGRFLNGAVCALFRPLHHCRWDRRSVVVRCRVWFRQTSCQPSSTTRREPKLRHSLQMVAVIQTETGHIVWLRRSTMMRFQKGIQSA
jgi:hypothetical protein